MNRETELTNMVMVQDKNTGKVLVQQRVKSWKGLSFPGGHVEDNESFLDSAVREVKEETGLDIDNLKPCGIIHWSNRDTFERYLVFLYKTTHYSGTLLEETEEGKVFWEDIETLQQTSSPNGFEKYLPVFLNDTYNEVFCCWDENSPETEWKIIYK